MKILIVDDDFTSRRILQKILSNYGECDVAINGKEAIEAFSFSIEENNPYKLICLDINMPEMTGQEALKKIREIESENNIKGLDGTKVIMTTAMDDKTNIIEAFREQCEAYLVKPIEVVKLQSKLKELQLIK